MEIQMQVSTTTAAQSRNEFLNLLVSQLRNQDPMEPVKQEDFLAQLAQFSTLEGVEKLNANFEAQLSMQQDTRWMEQLSQASSLIGKSVIYKNEAGEPVEGRVNSVQINADSFSLLVNDQKVELDRLVQVDGIHTADLVDASATEPDQQTDTLPEETPPDV
jgi:flagellar basal-body rod modification protein FlgD